MHHNVPIIHNRLSFSVIVLVLELCTLSLFELWRSILFPKNIAFDLTQQPSTFLLTPEMRSRILLSGRILDRFPRMKCLMKVLVVRRYLLRRGIASVLRVGAIGKLNSCDIHAWIEIGGDVFFKGDKQLVQFQSDATISSFRE